MTETLSLTIPGMPVIEIQGQTETISFDAGRFSILSELQADDFNETISLVAGRFTNTLQLSCDSWERFFYYIPPAVSKTTYRCYITGAPNGLSDLILPISSFQSRLRSGDPTFLEVVVPSIVTYSDDIYDRPDGELVVEMVIETPGEDTQYKEIVRVAFDDFAYDLGPKKKTGRISGEKTTTNSETKTVELQNVATVAMQKNGLRRIRCDIDFFTRPGDTVTWGSDGDTMTAGTVALSVGTHTKTMDITELES